jgi:hypothetical protein
MGPSGPNLMRNAAVLRSRIKNEKTVDNGLDLAEPSVYCAAMVVGSATRFAYCGLRQWAQAAGWRR